MTNPYHRIRADVPTECRDLHKIITDDGTPLIPLDHWGHGCPFACDETKGEPTHGYV